MRQPTYPEFPLEEYIHRNSRAQRILQENDVDALFVTMYENVEWFTGFGSESWKIYDKAWWAVVPAVGAPAITVDAIHEGNVEGACVYDDVRFWGWAGKSAVDCLVQIFKDRDLEDKRVAMEYGHGTRLFMAVVDWDEIRRRLPHVQWIDGGEIIGEMRAVKSQLEIERIRKATKITCLAMETAFNSFRFGMTERDLVGLMKRIMLEQGADATVPGVGGYLALSAARHNQVTPRTVAYRAIERGDLIHVDGGATYRGYYSDIYRVAIVDAEPHPFIQRCAETVAQAIDAVVRAVRPGIRSSELCSVAWEVIQKNGLGNNVRAFTDTVSVSSNGSRLRHIGHGLGFGVHDYPFITPTNQMAWLENMVASVEIMLGDPDIGWVEFEDNIVVTDTGTELLSPMEKKIWRLQG